MTATHPAPPISEIARRLDQAERKGIAINQFGDVLSLDAAYEVQTELRDLRLARGEHLTGAKLGFTSEAKMAQMGVKEVIVGFLTSTMEVHNGDRLRLDGSVHPRVEPEVAFRFGQAVPPDASEEQIIASVDAVAPALEIIDSRYLNFSFSLGQSLRPGRVGYLYGRSCRPDGNTACRRIHHRNRDHFGYPR